MPQGSPRRPVSPHAPPARVVAPHVQAAIGRSLQPKARAAMPGAQVSMAAHVRAAVAQAAPAPPPPRAHAVVQRMIQSELTGEYAQVGSKLQRYAQWLYEKWEAKLIEGQSLGRPAPNLGVHAGKNSNYNDSAEARIKKAEKALTKWYQSLSQSKKDRGSNLLLDEEEKDEHESNVKNITFNRIEVNREEKKKVKKKERQIEYESSEKQYTYVAPWHGGPSSWWK
ncbi:MAG TPA: hypothetical protein VF017_11715 [Thermoanaerobaculia bacterium]|nr:hypothetical protein [Thermoanaerobaculia bacterium]